MKAFAQLVQLLGTSTKTNDKLQSLQTYFQEAPDADKVWVIALFTGRRPKRIVTSTLLRNWCIELCNIPAWLFEECYHTAGDLAETIALLLPVGSAVKSVYTLPLSYYMEQFRALLAAPEEEKKNFITTCWQQMDKVEQWVFNKLITGGFRIGVSQQMMVNALAKHTGLAPSVIAHRLSGNWDPGTIGFDDLLLNHPTTVDHSKPYPFYLAYALEEQPAQLGEINQWQAEWKWDGIRGQMIQRNQTLFVWSRGEELVTEKFPELSGLVAYLPNGTVLDGEIICVTPSDNKTVFQPLPFALLQTRIGRKTISKKQLQEAPVGFIAYDVLEWQGKDIRLLPLKDRRELLEQVVTQSTNLPLYLSPVIKADSWDQLVDIRTQSRNNSSEGLMLKRQSAIYQNGRKKGDWWKWKIDPLTIDAVMIYAQKGHGRRSNLYTDYTFAVKDGDQLVSFAKAYSGLTDQEFAQVDAFVKSHSIEKFGPVRTVQPQLVFEIAFEGIAASNRHKSGVAVRFPRISRWRKDKKLEDINTLDDLKALLHLHQQASPTADSSK